jgi:hypothetical protein
MKEQQHGVKRHSSAGQQAQQGCQLGRTWQRLNCLNLSSGGGDEYPQGMLNDALLRPLGSSDYECSLRTMAVTTVVVDRAGTNKVPKSETRENVNCGIA